LIRVFHRGTFFAVAAAIVVPLVTGAGGTRRSAPATVWDSVYSPAQAVRGESSYVKACARCHQASLTGADQSPPLAGSGFLGNWNGLPLSDLRDRIRTTMPPDSIGLYDRQFVTDVIAYMLKMNGFPAGAGELSPETDRLKAILMQVARP
jgi:S-disulfanyl-L-cysteine oxidoreductase SoxD